MARTYKPQSGAFNPMWKGGRCISSGGYVLVRVFDHPRASNGYVFEHIVVAEAALGRHLPVGAVVHHADENKTHNAGGNLVVCENGAYHRLLHQRTDALAACGNPNALKCSICGSYDNQDDVYVTVTAGGGRAGRHRECRSRQAKAFRVRNAQPRKSRYRDTCFKGHPLMPENTYAAPKSGLRTCRICRRNRGRLLDKPRADITLSPLTQGSP